LAISHFCAFGRKAAENESEPARTTAKSGGDRIYIPVNIYEQQK